MCKELKPLEAYSEFLDIIEVPVKSHLLNSNDKLTLERYRVLRTKIEDALKKQEQDQKKLKKYQKAKELISKILDVGDINTLKDFKEMLIEAKEMNDELFELPINYQNQLKAFEIIKDIFEVWEDNGTYHIRPLYDIARITKEEYDLLKEVL